MKYAGSIGLTLALVVAGVVGACGPATPEGQVPPTPTADATATGTPPPSATPSATDVAPPGTAAPTATTTAPAGTAKPSAAVPAGPPIMASKLGDELKKAGFDLAKLPAKFDKIPDAQKKKVMPIFVKALGYESCTGCHVEGDFKKKTRNTEIAENMWDHFVASMRDEKGAATIFCDSCHQGKPKFLNRADLKGVGKFMDDEYVNHLARADKKDHGCATCHGDTMEMKIFDKMWAVPK